MTYKVFMRDGTTRTIVATCPTTAKWEAERIAIDTGADPRGSSAQVRLVRVTKAATKCTCGRQMSKYARKCNRCHKAHMDALHAEARAIVETGICPQCGSGLRRNLSLAGWWQCSQFGRTDRRTRQQDPECDFQTFTE